MSDANFVKNVRVIESEIPDEEFGFSDSLNDLF